MQYSNQLFNFLDFLETLQDRSENPFKVEN